MYAHPAEEKSMISVSVECGSDFQVSLIVAFGFDVFCLCNRRQAWVGKPSWQS
jgi:hypothetical protein